MKTKMQFYSSKENKGSSSNRRNKRYNQKFEEEKQEALAYLNKIANDFLNYKKTLKDPEGPDSIFKFEELNLKWKGYVRKVKTIEHKKILNSFEEVIAKQILNQMQTTSLMSKEEIEKDIDNKIEETKK